MRLSGRARFHDISRRHRSEIPVSWFKRGSNRDYEGRGSTPAPPIPNRLDTRPATAPPHCRRKAVVSRFCDPIQPTSASRRSRTGICGFRADFFNEPTVRPDKISVEDFGNPNTLMTAELAGRMQAVHQRQPFASKLANRLRLGSRMGRAARAGRLWPVRLGPARVKAWPSAAILRATRKA